MGVLILHWEATPGLGTEETLSDGSFYKVGFLMRGKGTAVVWPVVVDFSFLENSSQL